MPRRNWTEADLAAHNKRTGKRCGVEQVVARQSHKLKIAGSTPAPATKYRSKWEPLYAAKLAMELKLGMILDYRYEPSIWYLEDYVAGRRRKMHKPDFWILRLDRSIKIVAVKGWHKNIRDSLTIIRWAAQRYPWFEWWVTWLKQGIWEEERV